MPDPEAQPVPAKVRAHPRRNPTPPPSGGGVNHDTETVLLERHQHRLLTAFATAKLSNAHRRAEGVAHRRQVKPPPPLLPAVPTYPLGQLIQFGVLGDLLKFCFKRWRNQNIAAILTY